MKPVSFDDSKAARIMEEHWGFRAEDKAGKTRVASVRQDGAASFLRKGDIIRSLGEKPVRGVSDLLAQFRQARMADQVLIMIERKGRNYYGRIMPG
ncbi:MAG: PDZ domain-containing protein [Desulfovibrio sp.]|nr:PDZ domain-containing protein [Desulfovibrio sp.]